MDQELLREELIILDTEPRGVADAPPGRGGDSSRIPDVATGVEVGTRIGATFEPSTCLRTRVVLGKKHDLAVEDHVGIAVTEATREFGGRAGYRRVLSVGEQNDGVARYSTQGDVAADDPHLVEHVQATRPSSRQFDEVEAMCNRGFGQQVNQVISGKANSETSDAKWCSHTVLSSGVTGAYSGIEETLSCLPECEAPPRRKVLE